MCGANVWRAAHSDAANSFCARFRRHQTRRHAKGCRCDGLCARAGYRSDMAAASVCDQAQVFVRVRFRDVAAMMAANNGGYFSLVLS
jgi:hypothetical protein